MALLAGTSVALAAAWFAFALPPSALGAAALPGTVNYVEGQVAVDGRAVVADGSPQSVIGAGHVLETGRGKAEVLLTPGVFLRLAESSALRMEAAGPGDVRVELLRGEALVEVAEIRSKSRLDVLDHGADARLEKPGIYVFHAGEPAIAVYAGKVRVEDDRRVVAFGKGEELLPAGNGAMKPRRFDRTAPDDLYHWSEERAAMDAEVSEWTGESLLALGSGDGPFDRGWYWNPWFGCWAFVPVENYRLTPFGYGYYSPATPHFLTPVFGDFRH